MLPAPVIVNVRPVPVSSERSTVPKVVEAVLLTVNVRLAPELVNVPFKARPLVPASVLLPVNVVAFGSVITEPLTFESVPPPNVSAPVDGRDPALPKANVPALTVVPPVYVFACSTEVCQSQSSSGYQPHYCSKRPTSPRNRRLHLH